MESWISGTGQRLYVHDFGSCWGPYCPIHAPSQHALVSARSHWRDDRGIMERICDHGIGHPDPDDWKMIHGIDGEGVHSCDGCCRKVDDEPGSKAQEAA